MKVIVTEAEIRSDYEEIKEFENKKALLDFMKNDFHSWVVEWEWYKSEESEAEIKITKYNYYIE